MMVGQLRPCRHVAFVSQLDTLVSNGFHQGTATARDMKRDMARPD